jgi:hypothetical protein
LVDLVLKIHAQSRVMATSNQFFSWKIIQLNCSIRIKPARIPFILIL